MQSPNAAQPQTSTDTFSAYVPYDRRGIPQTDIEVAKAVSGTALFADIAGFSTLNQQLEESLGARRGAELLSTQLNQLYTAIIDEVHRYGGSIIDFSGDAILCWFEGDVGLQGLSSAAAIQTAMTRLNADMILDNQQLSIKIALANGEAVRLLVGDPKQRVFDVLTGPLMQQIDQAETLANAGEILVNSQLAENCQGQFTVSRWIGKAYAVVGKVTALALAQPLSPSLGLSPELSRPWLLEPVYERLSQGHGDYLTELRRCACMFVNFGTADADNKLTTAEHLTPFVTEVQNVLRRYNGHILQLSTSDKGNYLYCVFGAPLSHEDDLGHAIEAVNALQQVAVKFPYVGALQIGLNYGRTRVGAYGSESRRTYGVLGNVVNVSARLMQAAEPGQCLVTQAVVEALYPRYQFQHLADIELKGSAEPVPVYTVHKSAQTSANLQATMPLFGREQELAQLQHSLQSNSADVQQTVFVEGEAGIGKSHLIDTFFEQHIPTNVRKLRGNAFAVQKTAPYFAWRLIFQQLIDPDQALEPHNLAGWQTAVHDLLTQWLPERLSYAPLLNIVLPVELAETPITQEMDDEVYANNVAELLGTLLRIAAQQQPTVIVLEDAHWLDSASWQLVSQLQQYATQLLLVMVQRPSLMASVSEYHQMRQADNTQLLELAPLELARIEEILCHRLGVADIPAEVLTLVGEKAEGNPFYSTEFLLALRDARVLEVGLETGTLTFHTQALSTLELPDTIEGVIVSRVDNLQPQQQLMLKVASVIGRLFGFQTLLDIYPVSIQQQQLRENLDDVYALALTDLESLEPELRYLFKHIITQEVIYSLNTFAQRKELHASIAEWYETNYAYDLAQYYALLVYHWKAAENVEKTVFYLERSGELALRNNANQEAIRFYSEAMALAPQANVQADSLQYANWVAQIGHGHYRLGDLERAADYGRQALALLGAAAPSGRARLGLALLGSFGNLALNRVCERLHLPLIGSKSRERGVTLASIAQLLADIHFIQDDDVEFIYYTLKTLIYSQRSNEKRNLPVGYSALGFVLGLVRHNWAMHYLDKAIKVGLATGAKANLGVAYKFSGIYKIGIGQRIAAEKEYIEGLELYQEINDHNGIGDLQYCLLRVHHSVGAFDTAIEVAKELYQTGVLAKNKQHQGWGLIYEAMCRIELGEYDAADTLRQQAITTLGPNMASMDALDLQGMHAIIASLQGDYAKGLALADEVKATLEASSAIVATIASGFGLAFRAYKICYDGLESVAARAEILSKMETILKLLRNFVRFFPVSVHELNYRTGQYEALLGNTDAAVAALKSNLELTSIDMNPIYFGKTHYVLAELMAQGSDARAHHQAQAVHYFSQIQSPVHLAQAHELN